MRYGSVCSGIEAATVAWHPLGWDAAWLSEIDAFPSAVLKHHYPDVPNLGDMTLLPERIRSGEVEAPDVLVGGTPCQGFSIAGLRGGLKDARGQLTLAFVEIANAIDERRAAEGKPPVIIVWENVVGVLTDKTNAFGHLLGALAGEDDALVPTGKKWTHAGAVLGPERTLAWRVLDAQYFGVAQRRQRVFVVASAGTISPPEVLFEREGVRRDTPPGRSKEEVVAALTACGVGTCGPDDNQAQAGHLIPIAFNYQSGGSAMQLSFNPDQANTLQRSQEQGVFVAFGGNNTSGPIDVATARNACSSPSGRMDFETETFLVEPVSMGVRRITPTESERLQGFPDGWTKIPWRKKDAEDCPDGPRQKSLGNSMAVPVMSWLGQRIAKYHPGG